ncbi:MAG: serine/threonine protein kinase [Myxococcota bacterium]|jgi:serine/threonine protein kinase
MPGGDYRAAMEHPTFAGWEVIEELGRGGMCAVYRARPTAGDGPERAIKVLTDTSPNATERFRAEAELLGTIDHPNVLRVHTLDDGPPPWIVLDLLGGLDLEENRNVHGPMDPEQAATLFAGLADGLEAVHALGVRHRDLKPANVMLGHDGVPRLIDFGIARQTADSHVTAQGYVVGTASYLPPEIFGTRDTGGVQDTEVADVYALGQTLCETLAGVPVHARITAAASAVLVDIMRDKVEREHLDPREWRSQVPAELAAIVMQATAREPARRLQTAKALADALRGWIVERRSRLQAPVTRVDPKRLPAPPPTPRPVPRRVPTPAAAAAGGAVGAAGAAAASAAGASVVGLAIAGLTAVALVILWWFAPPAPTADSAERARAAVPTAAIEACAKGRGETVARWRIAGRRASAVQVEGPAAACVKAAIERTRFPAGLDGAEVSLPIRFE